MPSILIDEFNRLPEGKQAIVEELIRTGHIEHLNKVFSRGDIPFFATANYESGGTYSITPPNLDRFAVSLEFTQLYGWQQDYVEDAKLRIEKDLRDLGFTERILKNLNQKEKSYKKRLKQIESYRVEFSEKLRKNGLEPFSPEEEEKFKEIIEEVKLTPDAKEFLDCLYDEFNITSSGDFKRTSEKVDLSSHNRDLANSKIENSVTSRRRSFIREYSKMLAIYNNKKEVGVDLVKTVAPYCLAHTLDFTKDYEAEHAGEPKLKNERKEMDLARRLVNGIKERYDEIAEDCKLIDIYRAGKKLSKKQRKRLNTLRNGAEPDHPHLKILVKYLE